MDTIESFQNITNNDDLMAKKPGKKRSQKFTRVRKACLPCAKMHAACDDERPCKRCISRNLECIENDAPRKRGKKASTTNNLSLDNVVHASVEIPASPANLTASPSVLAYPSIVTSSSPLEPLELSPDSFLESLVDLPNDLQMMFADVLLQPQSMDSEQYKDFENDSDHYIKVMIPTARETLLKHGCSEEEITTLFATVYKIKERMSKFLKEKLGMDNVPSHFPMLLIDSHQKEINEFIQEQSRIFQDNATPTIIYDQCGVIYWINDAFRTLTSWNAPLPTQRNLAKPMLAFCPQVSPKYMKDCGIHHLRMLTSITNGTPMKHYMHGMGFRDYSKDTIEYIDGTLSVTVKYNKDSLPYIFLGNFLPDPRLVKTEPITI